MLKSMISLLKSSAQTRKERRHRHLGSVLLQVEILETLVMPVVGSLAPAPLVLPGSNLDGVVQLVNLATNEVGSGSELANQTEILTAGHVVPGGPPTGVMFNLQRAGTDINIPILVPANPAGGAATANYLFPTGNLAYNPAGGQATPNDIAVVNLRDTLPLPAGLPANLRLIAPFSPFENGYAIAPINLAVPNTLPLTFTMVGYGRQGTGATGQGATAPPFGQKTVGRNQFDQTQPGAPGAPGLVPANAVIPPGAVAVQSVIGNALIGRAANLHLLEYDFDGGGLNPFPGSGTGLGNANRLGWFGGNAPAPWLNEAGAALGDSGGPALLGTVGNGINGLSGGANNVLQIAGVASFVYPPTANAGFGSFGGYTLANDYAANLITPAQNTAYGAILDMRDQVLGAGWNTTSAAVNLIAGMRTITPANMLGYITAGANLIINAGQDDQEIVTVSSVTNNEFTANFARNHPNGITISSQLPQDNLTITVGRGTAAGAWASDGPNLLIRVRDTAQPLTFQYNANNAAGGLYFDQPLLNGMAPLINSVALRGNGGTDTFVVLGNLSAGLPAPIPIRVISAGANNQVQYEDSTAVGTTYQIASVNAMVPFPAQTIFTATPTVGGVNTQGIAVTGIATFTVDAGGGGNIINVHSTNNNQAVIINSGRGSDTINVLAVGFSSPVTINAPGTLPLFNIPVPTTTVNIGSNTNMLSSINAAVNVNGYRAPRFGEIGLDLLPSNTVLNINDQGAAADPAQNYTVTNASVTRGGGGGPINYSAVNQLTLRAAPAATTTIQNTSAETTALVCGAGNTVMVQGTAPNTTTTVTTGAGAAMNNITVTNGFRTLGDILGNVNITVGSPFNTALLIDDSGIRQGQIYGGTNGGLS